LIDYYERLKGAGAPNKRGVGRKVCNFQQISRRISETVQDRPRLGLLWRTNRKSHMSFRLVPESSTLDDLEQPIRILLQKRCDF